MTKAELRQQMRAETQRHSAEERRTASAKLCEVVRRHAAWQSARSVLLFMPTVEEPDISPLVTEALREGRSVALPGFAADLGIYQALQVTDLVRDLAPGRFGIAEPCAGCPPLLVNALDLILVPGLAFAPDGTRLGRGKGFYDRLLAQVTPRKCGIAFDWQVLEAIPREPHDVIVDCIATPSGVVGA